MMKKAKIVCKGMRENGSHTGVISVGRGLAPAATND